MRFIASFEEFLTSQRYREFFDEYTGSSSYGEMSIKGRKTAQFDTKCLSVNC